MEFKNPFSMIIFILVLLTSLPCCSAQEEDTQQQPQEAEVHELPVQWYRDEAPPPTSVVNSKAFATPQQRFYDTPVSSPQFVDRNQQYRPPNPPVWNPPANPQYVNSKSGPEPPPGQFSNWPPTQPNQNPYQAPAQRPEEVAYNQQGNQQPQLSFRSPSGQFSSVSSSSQLSLPSGPQNIAYYQPNQPSATPNYGSEYTPSENLGNKRPPVLLIGNFPPRQGAGPNPPQPGATFPYVPTTPLPFVTRYSPPNGPTVRPYATPAAPGEEEYGSPPSPEKGGENPYESPKPSPPAPGFKQPPRPIPLPFPPSPSEDETPPIIPKADVFYPPQKPGEEQPGYETSGGPTPPPGRGQSPSPEQLEIPGQPPSPSKPQVPGQPPRVPGQPPLSEVPCQPPRLPGQPKMPLSPGQEVCQPGQPPQVPGQPPQVPEQPPSSEVPCQPPRLPGQPQVPLSPGQEVCQPGQPPQVPGQPPQIPGQTPQIPSQPPQIPGQPPTLSGKPPSPVQPEQPGQPQVPGFPPQVPGQPSPGQPQVPGQPPSFPGQPRVPGQPPQLPGQPPSLPGQPRIPGQPPQIPGQPPSPGQPQVPGQPPSSPGQPRIPGQPPQTPGLPPSAQFPDQPPRFQNQPTPPPQFPTLVPPGQRPPSRQGFPSFPRSEFTPPPFIPGRPYSPLQPGQPTSQPPQPSQPSPPPPPPLRPSQPAVPTPPPEVQPPNRMRGKARVICEETGIEFGINTIFPFTGQIFAHDRKRIPNCVHAFNKAWNINVSFSYSECGIKNTGNESSQQAQFHLQIIVMFEQADKSTSIQSFIAQCGQQKVNYNKQTIPKRIEEALEELKLVPTQLEQKAPIPEAQMHVVTDVEHHKPGDGTEVIEVNVGQPLRVEFSLQPESDAYGFHVRNCVVKDMVSGAEHQVIDDKGCSTDLNIFAHPHYDTYHDVARVHWHAFKLPDHTQLSVRCHIEICTEINDESGMNSCAAIPTPPFCPDLITSPSNSILSDANGNLVRRRYVKRQTENLEAMVQAVHADICFGKNKTSASRNKRDYCDTEQFNKDRQNHLERLVEEDYDSATKICASRIWINLITSFCAGVLALAALLNLCAVILGRRRGNWSTNSKQQHITTQPKLENHAKEFRFVGAALPVTSFK